ncbi:MAG: transposase [Desulfurococcaceae archaeon]|jgi:transposase|nr:transposase [Desulfurococcaceae archaeon]MCC6060662.1 transposase [Desulfurococcaceae archaeon]
MLMVGERWHRDVVAVLNIRARALEALKAPYEGDV